MEVIGFCLLIREVLDQEKSAHFIRRRRDNSKIKTRRLMLEGVFCLLEFPHFKVVKQTDGEAQSSLSVSHSKVVAEQVLEPQAITLLMWYVVFW